VRDDVQEISRQNVRIRSLAAALLGEQLEVSMRPASSVRVGARRHNGATYVIAVNSADRAVTTSFGVRGFRSATALLYGERRTHAIRRGAISDRFQPFAVHVYVVPPGGERPDPPRPRR
jgi:hypothetical protein